MKIVILDASTMGADIDLSPILGLGDCTVYQSTSKEECVGRIKDADIVILNKVVLSADVLEKAKNLKLICLFAIGFNNVDIEYCKGRNILVRNVPGYCIDSVCQHTFALLFSLIENIRYYDDFVKDKKYSKSGIANHIGIPFGEIAGKKWGIIGMGAIGRKTADVAAAFGADVCYSSVSGVSRKEKYPCVPMETLLRESDIISLSTPLNEKTTHLIGEKELDMMKESAVLINVSRGAVIDEDALSEAIDSGKIAGAGIDVYSTEPPREDFPLINVKNTNRVVFSPHIAWASVEARANCISMTAENIRTFLNGERNNDVW